MLAARIILDVLHQLPRIKLIFFQFGQRIAAPFTSQAGTGGVLVETDLSGFGISDHKIDHLSTQLIELTTVIHGDLFELSGITNESCDSLIDLIKPFQFVIFDLARLAVHQAGTQFVRFQQELVDWHGKGVFRPGHAFAIGGTASDQKYHQDQDGIRTHHAPLCSCQIQPFCTGFNDEIYSYQIDTVSYDLNRNSGVHCFATVYLPGTQPLSKLPMSKPAPTKSELKLLQALWERGPSTVREVHDSVASESGVSYTTTLKQLQIMHEKGLVERETSTRAHRYTAGVDGDETRRGMLDDFMQRVYQGSASELVIQALGLSRPASAEELEEIERLIEEMKLKSSRSSGRE